MSPKIIPVAVQARRLCLVSLSGNGVPPGKNGCWVGISEVLSDSSSVGSYVSRWRSADAESISTGLVLFCRCSSEEGEGVTSTCDTPPKKSVMYAFWRDLLKRSERTPGCEWILSKM